MRERSDRLALINRILDEETSRCGVRLGLAGAALECLLGYRWPGNVRQLRHVLRYACAVCGGDTIQLGDLPVELRGEVPVAAAEEAADCPERQALLDALVRHRWKPGPAAAALGISRATLYRRVNQHGIEMPGKSRG
ncbi:Acetoin catabolism regulatory protein [compost metagenome]